MSRYTRQIAQAQRLVAKYGQKVTWRQQATTIADMSQPWKPSNDGAPGDTEVSIVFLRASGGLANALFHLIHGTDIPDGGPRGIMAAVDFTPNIGDQVIRDGTTMVIKTIDPVEPDGTAILYNIEFC